MGAASDAADTFRMQRKLFLLPLAYAVIAGITLLPAYIGNEDGLGFLWFEVWTAPTSLLLLLAPKSWFSSEPSTTLLLLSPALVNTLVLTSMVLVVRTKTKRAR